MSQCYCNITTQCNYCKQKSKQVSEMNRWDNFSNSVQKINNLTTQKTLQLKK